MPLSERFTARESQQLLEVARQAITSRFTGAALKPDALSVGAALQAQRACFVTLRQRGLLRGCMGNLQAESRLLDAVVNNALLAAFQDPRFEPLTPEELGCTVIEISVLTPPCTVSVSSQAELLSILRPGVDGLTIRYKQHQATFLPAVWDQIPAPAEFVTQLKHKAGLASDFWDAQLHCDVYQAVKVSE